MVYEKTNFEEKNIFPCLRPNLVCKIHKTGVLRWVSGSNEIVWPKHQSCQIWCFYVNLHNSTHFVTSWPDYKRVWTFKIIQEIPALKMLDRTESISKFPQLKILEIKNKEYQFLIDKLLWVQKAWLRLDFTWAIVNQGRTQNLYWLSLIHIWRCRRSTLCRSLWSPYH